MAVRTSRRKGLLSEAALAEQLAHASQRVRDEIPAANPEPAAALAPATATATATTKKYDPVALSHEMMLRLCRIAALANEALGSIDAVGVWLQEPNHALGGVEPIVLLQTDAGKREVEAVLSRALYGGFS